MSVKIPSEIIKIELDDASFKGTGTTIDNLTFINFFFGNNGSGKSTIAQAIKSGKGITYARGNTASDYLPLVYDESFINLNFHSYKNMPGVFTINEVNKSIQEQIDALHKKENDFKAKIDDAEGTIEQKKNDRTAVEKQFWNECWDKSLQLRILFDKTLAGTRNSKKVFASAILPCTPIKQDTDELKRLYDSAFSSSTSHYKVFSFINDTAVLDNLPGNEVLGIAIVNSSDTNFAQFIRRIKSTEWVRQGHEQFSHVANGLCPYCAQPLPEKFEELFTSSFDAQYEDNLKSLTAFRESYRNAANELFVPLSVPDPLYSKIDAKLYTDKLDELKTIIKLNLELIANKISNPAVPVTLKATAPVLEELDGMIMTFNQLITENNIIVSDIPEKRKECTKKVLSHIAFELKETINNYKRVDARLVGEIQKLEQDINDYDGQWSGIRGEIKELSSKTIETDSAKEKINLMLRDTGMHGFQLEPHKNQPHVYQVVRPDGSIADNLSEGEKNFLAFLYFYYLVQGRESTEEDSREKIVVIDDPVSSMDSNSLFIVSTLVKDMIEVCRNNADNENATTTGNYIKQLFILTHNAFFHHEITYSYVSRYEYISFFLVRKPSGKSSVKFCDAFNPKEPSERINVNPVKNSYAALWEEYNEIQSAVPLMNVIRKILEYYFLQLCGYEGATLRKVILQDNKGQFFDANGNFDEEKFILASSMLSYISAGTVGINDGMYHVDDCLDTQECRDMFEMIFKLMQQEQHFIKMCKPYTRKKT